MAPGNFEHIDVGPTLSRVEWELSTAHHLASQATGDIIFASSAAQLEGRAIGAVGQHLGVVAGLPAWTDVFAASKTFQDNIEARFGTTPQSRIYSDGTDTFWDLRLNGAGGLMLALAAGFPSPKVGAVNIWKGDSGLAAPSAAALLTLEDNANIVLALMTPAANSAFIHFGDPGDNDAGGIQYSHVTNGFTFRTSGGDRFAFSSGGVFQSAGVTELGIAVTNDALTVGTSGSIVMPYLRAAVAIGTDALFGDLNGAMAVLSDSGGADTIETRVEGAWVSVAVAGYIINDSVSMLAGGWTHLQQHRADGRLDETICIQCGEQMRPYDQVTMWANKVVSYSNDERSGEKLHAAFGHLHPEEDPYISRLEERVRELESALKVAA